MKYRYTVYIYLYCILVLVGADEFVVHIHTLNLRPNRDVMRHSKALSKWGRGGADRALYATIPESDSERITRLVVRAVGRRHFWLRRETSTRVAWTYGGGGAEVGGEWSGDVDTAFSDIQTSQKGEIFNFFFFYWTI